MLQDIINKTFFSKRSIPRGLDEQEIQIFKNEVNLEMSYELPDDYLFLLSQINCPCFDGFYIYGKINSDILQNFPRLKTCDFLFMNRRLLMMILRKITLFLVNQAFIIVHIQKFKTVI